mmetsp:Transcript_9930/g.26254  ORF Transcript_9930/g.26254 Transcript_9930/m.26254 type:complete len:129 (+) Transcript_9930:116-502(+)
MHWHEAELARKGFQTTTRHRWPLKPLSAPYRVHNAQHVRHGSHNAHNISTDTSPFISSVPSAFFATTVTSAFNFVSSVGAIRGNVTVSTNALVPAVIGQGGAGRNSTGMLEKPEDHAISHLPPHKGQL